MLQPHACPLHKTKRWTSAQNVQCGNVIHICVIIGNLINLCKNIIAYRAAGCVTVRRTFGFYIINLIGYLVYVIFSLSHVIKRELDVTLTTRFYSIYARQWLPEGGRRVAYY